MAPRRTFFLVPADAVTQPTIATPRPLAPSPHVLQTVQYVMKPVNERPLSADPVEILLGEPSQPHQRKRECLDHLTHEQKLNRRKMKNRIAAQTARDRKKYRSQRLEDVIRELLEQNEALKRENEMLRIANNDLDERNRSLMATFSSSSNDVSCRVETKEPMFYEEMHYEMIENSGKAVESAAFISGPLPRRPEGGLLQSEEIEKILNDFSNESLEFDLDQLFQQLPDEQLTIQQCTNEEQMCKPTCSTPDISPPADAGFLNVPRCSPSFAPSYPLLNSPELVDEMTLLDSQKLLDDPMLSSPSSCFCDNPHALSPFSDSFQREFFQMLE